MNRRDILKSLAALPGVTAVERLDLSTAAALVVTFNGTLDTVSRERIQREVEAFTRRIGRDIPCLVLDGGLKVQTLGGSKA